MDTKPDYTQVIFDLNKMNAEQEIEFWQLVTKGWALGFIKSLERVTPEQIFSTNNDKGCSS